MLEQFDRDDVEEHRTSSDIPYYCHPSDNNSDNKDDDVRKQQLEEKSFLLLLSSSSSDNVKELICCIIFFIICIIIIPSIILPSNPYYIRDIPIQVLNDGEYVLNLSNNEEFDKNTVSSTLAMILGAFIPFTIQVILSKFCCSNTSNNVHNTICVYIITFSLTGLVTDILKWYCGYLRPSFIQLCQPDETYTYCTSSIDDENEARRSFPSGHASLSFCGLTLLTLFIHEQFGIPKYYNIQLIKGDIHNMTNKTKNNNDQQYVPSLSLSSAIIKYRFISIISLLPMGLAIFIAASRVHDNKHFPADIVAGSILGASIANYIHGLWFHKYYYYQ